MIERSWKWATERQLVRKNPVHGEEEAKLVLEDFFENSVELGESTRAEAEGAFEDYIKCHSDCPERLCKTLHNNTYLLFIYYI